MKKLVTIAMLIGGAFALAGCTTTATEIAAKITGATQTVTEKAKQAQGAAVTICGFLPALSTVISIFNSGYSQDVSAVGTAICNAVTNLPLADGPGDRKPRVNGIVVKGKFVR